ncbi:MAG: OsmC family protein [Proteobacteria bacterium]|nr:OsmC family protein [Pseudomonadota bacterium]
MAHEYQASIHWERGSAPFTDRRYSRGHSWTFDGGLTVPASSSPAVVAVPLSVEKAVDPEEALVASLSSCHMLFFLDFAAREGLVVDDYLDAAVGVMGRNAAGRIAMVRVTLRPRVRCPGAQQPSREQLMALHHRAHEACYIANSVNFDVQVEAIVAP